MIACDDVGMALFVAVVRQFVIKAEYSSISAGQLTGFNIFQEVNWSFNAFLNWIQLASLKLYDVRGDVGFCSTPIDMLKVSGLCPLVAPIIGCVSTFEIIERRG